MHRTVRRLLFASRVTGAVRDEQLGEHKTFLKASRWVYSRAATGRGAGRARCRFARARVRAEWLCQQQQAPPDMMTGQSIRTCLRRGPRGTQPYAAGTAAGMSVVRTLERELRRDCSPEAEAETRRSRADECTIVGSRAEQSLTRGAERRLRYRPSRQRLQRRGVSSDAQKWTTRGTAESTTMPTTRRPTELSAITYLHAQCLEGEESSSEWGWGLPDHA